MRAGIMKAALKVLLALVSLAWGCGAADAGENYLPDIQRIIDNGKLVVAVIGQEAPPMVMTDKDGKRAGFDVGLARKIAAELDVSLEFVDSARTYDEVVELVAGGKADIAISYLSRSPQRARSVYFTRPYVIQSTTLLINRLKGLKYNRSCPSVAEFIALVRISGQVGVLKETIYEDIVRRQIADSLPETFESTEDMMAAVRKGDVMATLQGELGAKYYLHRNPDAAIELQLCAIGRFKDYIAIAVRTDAPGLLRLLDIFLDNRQLHLTPDELLFRPEEWDF